MICACRKIGKYKELSILRPPKQRQPIVIFCYRSLQWPVTVSLSNICFIDIHTHMYTIIFYTHTHTHTHTYNMGFPGSSVVKNLPDNAGDRVQFLGREDPLEKFHGFLPGKSHGQRSLVGYSPWGHKRVKHDLATKRQQHI